MEQSEIDKIVAERDNLRRLAEKLLAEAGGWVELSFSDMTAIMSEYGVIELRPTPQAWSLKGEDEGWFFVWEPKEV